MELDNIMAEDNVAQGGPIIDTLDAPINPSLEEHMELFEKIDCSNLELANIAAKLDYAPHDQARVAILVQHCKKLQEQLDLMYSMMVSMNNLFGSK